MLILGRERLCCPWTQRRGGRIIACTPCVKSRGYVQADLLEGVEIAGASTIHALIREGAATLSF